MSNQIMQKLVIGDLVAQYPIIQGGMGVGISGANLASAVANEGGIGVISSVGLGLFDLDQNSNYKDANAIKLREEIRKAKRKTNGLLGVNLMQVASDFDNLIQIAVEEKIDIVFISAGLPLKNPFNMPESELKKIKIKFIPKISSERAARLIFEYWERKYSHIPDAIVIEGPLSGGHLGFKKENIDDPKFSLEKLLPKVIEIIKPFEIKFKKNIPVIAAGGIYTGYDIHKFIKLGASAVKMGTRFVTTEECDAADEFKQQYIHCAKDDIVIIDSPVGLPARVIKNKFIEEMQKGIKKPIVCPWKCLKTCDFRSVPYCIAKALMNAKQGNFVEGFAFAGTNAYKAEKIISVKELFKTLSNEYKECAVPVQC